MVWFWVDTTEFSHSIRLDIFFNWARPATNSNFYLWDGENQPTLGGTLPDAWGGGAGYGRIPIPAGYTGYVGLRVEDLRIDGNGDPLSGLLGGISEIYLYYETTDALPKTLFLDNIAISTEIPE